MPTMNVYGESVIEDAGKIGGMQARSLRRKQPNKIMVETINKVGDVRSEPTGLGDRYWREFREDSAMGRVVVAILSGPGAISGQSLADARARCGYKIEADKFGKLRVVLLPGESEIRRRREYAQAAMADARTRRPARSFSLGDAALLIANGAAAKPTEEIAALKAQNAAMAAQLAELMARLGPREITVTVPAGSMAAEDVPAPPAKRRP